MKGLLYKKMRLLGFCGWDIESRDYHVHIYEPTKWGREKSYIPTQAPRVSEIQSLKMQMNPLPTPLPSPVPPFRSYPLFSSLKDNYPLRTWSQIPWPEPSSVASARG